MQCRCTTVSIFERHFVPWMLPYQNTVLVKILTSMCRVLEQLHYDMPNELSLYLVDDTMIGRANTTFMNCTGPTNILSFPGTKDLSGTLLLSVETYLRECVLYGQDCAEYLIRLLAHGICHVAGLDHGVVMDGLSGRLQQIVIQELAEDDGIL